MEVLGLLWKSLAGRLVEICFCCCRFDMGLVGKTGGAGQTSPESGSGYSVLISAHRKTLGCSEREKKSLFSINETSCPLPMVSSASSLISDDAFDANN